MTYAPQTLIRAHRVWVCGHCGWRVREHARRTDRRLYDRAAVHALAAHGGPVPGRITTWQSVGVAS